MPLSLLIKKNVKNPHINALATICYSPSLFHQPSSFKQIFVLFNVHVCLYQCMLQSLKTSSMFCSLYLPRCGFNDNDACQAWFLRIMSKLTAPKQLNEFFAFTFHAWCQDHNSGSQDPENCYQLCQKGKCGFCTH